MNEGIPQDVLNNESNPLDEQEFREGVFLTYVHEQLLDTFEDALCEVPDIDDDEVEEWKDALLVLDDVHLSAFLAVPHEMLQRRLNALVTKGRREGVQKTVIEAADDFYKRGYRVAYHCSPSNSEPDPETDAWTIDGREADHRDKDIGMAYYSFDLKNLYRKKNPKYLYLIRADVSEETSHRQDGNLDWGRAPKLDVLTKVDYQDAMKRVEKRVEDYKKGIEKEKDDGTQ